MDHLFVKLCCSQCGKSFDVPVYCGDRFCTVCSVRRNNRVKRRLDFLVDNCERPRGFGFKFLTLTISNMADLSGMVKVITASFRKLRNRQYWKNNVDGGSYVIEIKGRPGNWHVHIHIIMQARFMAFADLLKLWMKCSPGRGVYIKQIPAGKTIAYITKYLTKPDVPDQALKFINAELQNVRLFSPFGCWHALCATYKPPKRKCADCGSDKYMPWDMLFDKFPEPFLKETSRSPPPKE